MRLSLVPPTNASTITTPTTGAKPIIQRSVRFRTTTPNRIMVITITMVSPLSSSLIHYRLFCFIVYPAPQDTDSDGDMYNQRNAPSAESLGGPRLAVGADSMATFADYQTGMSAREPYPAWSADRQIPLSKEEIEDIFLDLTQKFGFQRDSMRNMVRSLSFKSFKAQLTQPSP